MAKPRKGKQQAPQSRRSDQQDQGSRSEMEPHSSAIDDGVDIREATAGGAVAAEDQEDAGGPQPQLTDVEEHREIAQMQSEDVGQPGKNAKEQPESSQQQLNASKQQPEADQRQPKHPGEVKRRKKPVWNSLTITP